MKTDSSFSLCILKGWGLLSEEVKLMLGIFQTIFIFDMTITGTIMKHLKIDLLKACVSAKPSGFKDTGRIY